MNKFNNFPHGLTKPRGLRRLKVNPFSPPPALQGKGLRRKSLTKEVTYGLRSLKNSTVRVRRGDVAKTRRAANPRRIGKHWKDKPAVIIRKGREICNPATPEGRGEYAWRTFLLWLRQDGFCCCCLQKLKLKAATFEHEHQRTKGARDERIWADGLPMNGASHGWCNLKRGSKRTPIAHYPQKEQDGIEMDMITEDQALAAAAYLQGAVCVCTAAKLKDEPFCDNCRGRIGAQRQHDLETMAGPRFIQALESAKAAALGVEEVA